MPKTEDGEFELILGNRQLLSVFFIVVVLLGVFFTMGYIVGRNSAPGATETGGKIENPPIIVSPPALPSPTEPASPAATTPDPVPEASEAAGEPPGAQSAKAAPEGRDAEPARPGEQLPPTSPTPEEPVPGQTYLQVTAVARAEAELFVDVLGKKGFHAIYTPVPDRSQWYRVLVGPFHDAAAVAQARADLNKAGFKGYEALLRKY
jgi:cell division septation protein DedD